MNNEEWIDEELSRLREQALHRCPAVFEKAGGRIRLGSRTYLDFSSNDYLNLSSDPGVIAAAAEHLQHWGAGAGASRLVTGSLSCHAELETRLAAFKGYPSSLVFGSGYLANAGTITALVGRNDHVFADRLVHASIIDAVALSRARLHRFRHNDAGHLAELASGCPAGGRRLVITESVFSMDGDVAPLEAIAGVARENGMMLMVDEAHATGVFGPAGSGLVREHGLEPVVNVSMGTLSKAFGGYGGFVACSGPLRDLLVNRARAYIYTTALPPSATGSALAVLDMLAADPEMGSALLANAAFFRERLQREGLDTGESESQVIPVIVGDATKTLAVADRLREEGLLAIAIRPPTVPLGTARIRLSVTLAHSREDLSRAAAIVGKCFRNEGLL